MGNHRTSENHYSAFRAALDDAALTSTEHQLHFASHTGKRPRWKLTTNEAKIQFITRQGLIYTGTVHPIGAHKNNKWLWSWADTRITEPRRKAARQVRAFGQANQMQSLTTALSDLSTTRVTPDELIVSSKVIHRIWTHFVFPMPDGTTLYAAINLPEPLNELPAPTPGSIAQTLRTVNSLHPVTRPLRAVLSYAGIRGITHQVNRPKTAVRLHTPTGALDVTWDADGYRTALPPRAGLHTPVRH